MAATGLLEVGILKYGEFTFDQASHLTVNVSKIRDEAQRTVIYHAFELTVNTVITASGAGFLSLDSDLAMEQIRQQLSQDGQPLHLEARGFGTIKANIGRIKDVNFGPKTEILQWEPSGGATSCRIQWRCITYLPECGTLNRFEGVDAFNFGIEYDYNDRGFVTRTVSGYLQIALTRDKAGHGAGINDVADAYRRFAWPNAPLGFRRKHRWSLDKSKARINFSIIDEQLMTPNAFPPGIVDIKAKHRVGWRLGKKTTNKNVNTLSVSITRDPTASGLYAYRIFQSMFIRRAKLALYKEYINTPFIKSLDVSEDIYEFTCNFNISWVILRTLKEIIQNNALFTPMGFYSPGQDWSNWQISLGHSTFNAYGNSELKLRPQEKLISLCNQGSTSELEALNNYVTQYLTSIGSPAYSGPSHVNPAGDSPFASGTELKNVKPPAEKSWLEFDAVIIPWRKKMVAVQSFLQKKVEDYGLDRMNVSRFFDFGKSSGTDDVIQETGKPTHGATFVGKATRVGHPIPRPKLEKLGNKTAVETSSSYPIDIVKSALGVPVYELRWIVNYVIENSPETVKPRTDPSE